jgi:general secretion pathway protein D
MRAFLLFGLLSLFTAGISLPQSAYCDETADAEHDRVMKAERAIRAKLVEADSFIYEDMPLNDIVEDLRSKWDFPILLDIKALEESNVTPDQAVSINVPKVTRKSGLKLMLEPFELTYVIRDEVLMVTTREEAKRALFTYFYDVRDLVAAIEEDELRARKLFGDSAPAAATATKPTNTEPPKAGTSGAADEKPHLDLGTTRAASQESSVPKLEDPMSHRFRASDTIMTLVQETIAPDSWEEAGGPGRISMVAGVMVVSQTNDVQEYVEDMLGALRKILRTKPVSHDAKAH